MTDGVPGRLVLNRKGNYWQRKGDQRGTDTRKEGHRHTRGDIGQLGRESGKRHDRGIGANKRPLGASKGLGDELSLVTSERRENQEESKEEAKPEITENAKKWLQS